MEPFFCDATDKTPLVILDRERAKFEISGVSIPENGLEFYKPILKWFADYATLPHKETILDLNLDYFNISSSKMILFVFYKLMEIRDAGHKVVVNWHYSDELIHEAGTDYEYITKLDFEYLGISKAQMAE